MTNTNPIPSPIQSQSFNLTFLEGGYQVKCFVLKERAPFNVGWLVRMRAFSSCINFMQNLLHIFDRQEYIWAHAEL